MECPVCYGEIEEGIYMVLEFEEFNYVDQVTYCHTCREEMIFPWYYPKVKSYELPEGAIQFRGKNN